MMGLPENWPYQITDELLKALGLEPKPYWGRNFERNSWCMNREEWEQIVELANEKENRN
jgi:hypothetical protein